MADKKVRFKVFSIDALGEKSDSLEDRMNEWWTGYTGSYNAEIISAAMSSGHIVVAYRSDEEDLVE